MLVEPFARGESFVHRLDPRGKVVAAAVFTLLVALAHSLPALAGGAGLALILIFCARLPVAEVARRLVPVNVFNLFLLVILPLTYGSGEGWQIGRVGLSREGLALAGIITLKANTILLFFMALVASSPLVTMAYALQRLAVPEKLVYLLLFTFRYIHVIEQERQRLFNAAALRGFQPKVDRHTYRTYAYLVGMLLVKSFARSRRVYEAMLCRGFHGRLYSLQEFAFSRADFLVLPLLFAGAALLFSLEWLR